MGDRLYSLQVLRAFAACAVVLLHAGFTTRPDEPVYFQFNIGAAGVDVFFVLSGVIIALIASGSASAFLKRRIWRIVPLFWILAAIQSLILIDQLQWFNYAATLSFWPAWGEGYSVPVIGVGWTLCYEMLFYLSAALVLADRRALWLLAALFVGCWVGRIITDYAAFQFLGNPIILEFLIGVVIGMAWRSGKRISQSVAAALILGGLALWFIPLTDMERLANANHTMLGTHSLERVLVWGIPAALIVLGFLNLKVAWPEWLIATGDASYSIYLAHSVALSKFFTITLHEAMMPFAVPLYLFLSFSAAFFAYQWIERPLLESARRRRAGQLAAA